MITLQRIIRIFRAMFRQHGMPAYAPIPSRRIRRRYR